ncbi:hypothetical protein V2J09_001658 [Rumex salicifolius]
MSKPGDASSFHPLQPKPVFDPAHYQDQTGSFTNNPPIDPTGPIISPIGPHGPDHLGMMSRPLTSKGWMTGGGGGKNEAALYFNSDDRVLSKHVEGTHFPDDSRLDNVRPLFYVVQELFAQTAHTIQESVPGALARKDLVLGRSLQSRIDVPNLSIITERISSELASRRWGATTSDAHETSMAVLQLLSHYSWEAKVVFSLTAFAMSYGEFWLLSQIFTSNSLAKSMAMLKQIPVAMEHTGSYKNIFEAVDDLIRAMLDVTDCIIQFKELPPVYFSETDPAAKAARTHVPIAVYWTIRSAVTAASQITALTNLGELEAYEMIRKVIYNMIHVDNMSVLSRIVHLDVLRRKNVLLLISDLSISSDELSILEQIYNDSKIHAYDILWLPIVDQTMEWTEAMQVQFERLQGSMPWYSVHHPSKITKSFIKFARLDWNFRSKPVLVVLDPRGKVLCPNAIHMMWIWGSNAFPFTTEREGMLWNEELWRLELLIDGIDQTILDWFTREARAVAQAAGIKLEMIYVGKGNKKELVRKICATIKNENLSNCWQDPPMVWFFWKRIESMLFSKMELKKADDHSDIIIQEIKRILSYDKIPGGWALLSKGSEVILHGPLSSIITAIMRYEREAPYWKNEIPQKTFTEAFMHVVAGIHKTDLPCCRFEFPAIADPMGLLCPECHRGMEKHTTFVCCHEGGLPQLASASSSLVPSIEKMKL